MWTGRKGTFRPYQPLEPQPRGAVTRRAVAQRRSRASGLTSPLGVGYPGVLILVLLSGRLPDPLRYGVSLFFSASYPQVRRSCYLFFNYLFFNYLYGSALCPYLSGRGVCALPVGGCPESHKPVEISDLRPPGRSGLWGIPKSPT